MSKSTTSSSPVGCRVVSFAGKKIRVFDVGNLMYWSPGFGTYSVYTRHIADFAFICLFISGHEAVPHAKIVDPCFRLWDRLFRCVPIPPYFINTSFHLMRVLNVMVLPLTSATKSRISRRLAVINKRFERWRSLALNTQ